MTDLLFEAIDQLVPTPVAEGNWDDVLARSRQDLPARHPRRQRRVLVALSALVLFLIILFATPAFGLRSALFNLIGRTNVPFSTSKSAPNRVKKQYLDLDTRLADTPFAGRFGVAIAAEAREVGTFTINGHARKLWVVPTKSGGFCYIFERASGSCNAGGAAQRRERPLSVAMVTGPGPKLRTIRGTKILVPANGSILTQILGTITAANAAQLQIIYVDGARMTIPFVWVSQPIAAGFFAYDIPADRLRGSRRPAVLVLTDAHGKVLARDTRVAGMFHQAFPRLQPPSHRAFVPTKLPTSPSRPLQQGSGDGTSVVVGKNGFAVFDTRRTPLSRFPAQLSAAMYSCFRITKEFGIPGVAGDNVAGTSPQRALGEVRIYLVTAGPFDGCEISAPIGHTWPDKLGSHAAVEIPLTSKGRLYFIDRATARDLALFIHSSRLKNAWSPGGTRLASRLAVTFGKQLTRLPSLRAALSPGRVGYSLVPNGATFVETSPTGKRFTVTIVRRFISHQNLAPYTKAYLFWKRS